MTEQAIQVTLADDSVARLQDRVPQPLYSVDAVPFFPFHVEEDAECRLFKNPLDGCEEELNESSYRLLQLDCCL